MTFLQQQACIVSAAGLQQINYYIVSAAGLLQIWLQTAGFLLTAADIC